MENLQKNITLAIQERLNDELIFSKSDWEFVGETTFEIDEEDTKRFIKTVPVETEGTLNILLENGECLYCSWWLGLNDEDNYELNFETEE